MYESLEKCGAVLLAKNQTALPLFSYALEYWCQLVKGLCYQASL